jgi:hypothetical protein
VGGVPGAPGGPGGPGVGGGFPSQLSHVYRAERLLASGGYGDVYLATHLALDRPAAIKVLRREAPVSDPDVRARFVAEARIVASVSHPGIVRVLDSGVAGDTPWIAFEYLEGRTLRKVLETGRLAWREAFAIAEQVADALQAAHERGILHRDVKPENVIEAAAGTYKLADFGVAKWAASESVQTQAGLVLGTPGYVSPEQITGRPASPASDVYALGALLFEALTGRPPFTGEDAVATLRNQLEEPAPRPGSLVPGLPRSADDMACTALARDPAKRFRSAGDMREALRRALSARDDRPVPPRAPAAGARTPPPAAIAAVAAAVLALALALALALTQTLSSRGPVRPHGTGAPLRLADLEAATPAAPGAVLASIAAGPHAASVPERRVRIVLPAKYPADVVLDLGPDLAGGSDPMRVTLHLEAGDVASALIRWWGRIDLKASLVGDSARMAMYARRSREELRARRRVLRDAAPGERHALETRVKREHETEEGARLERLMAAERGGLVPFWRTLAGQLAALLEAGVPRALVRDLLDATSALEDMRIWIWEHQLRIPLEKRLQRARGWRAYWEDGGKIAGEVPVRLDEPVAGPRARAALDEFRSHIATMSVLGGDLPRHIVSSSRNAVGVRYDPPTVLRIIHGIVAQTERLSWTPVDAGMPDYGLDEIAPPRLQGQVTIARDVLAPARSAWVTFARQYPPRVASARVTINGDVTVRMHPRMRPVVGDLIYSRTVHEIDPGVLRPGVNTVSIAAIDLSPDPTNGFWSAMDAVWIGVSENPPPPRLPDVETGDLE